jgi:Na+/H+-dicarboxylate symporter
MQTLSTEFMSRPKRRKAAAYFFSSAEVIAIGKDISRSVSKLRQHNSRWTGWTNKPILGHIKALFINSLFKASSLSEAVVLAIFFFSLCIGAQSHGH